jgi:hypothetical protein
MEYGKRSRMIPTRAGIVKELFYVCYNCSAELSESDTAAHSCEVA